MSTQKINKVVKLFQTALEKKSECKTQKQLVYFNNTEKYRGLFMPQIQEIYKQIWSEQKEELSLQEKKKLANIMLQQKLFEDKQIGIYIYTNLLKEMQKNDIENIKQIIKQGHISSWGMVDTLCMRFMSYWCKQNKENSEYVASWRLEKEHMWVRRCSCVTFVTQAKNSDIKNFEGFTDLMFEIVKETVQYDERFNQLACGWLLRNLSINNRQRAIQFIEQNYPKFSREGLRYAIEKLDSKERQRLLKLGSYQKESQNTNSEIQNQKQLDIFNGQKRNQIKESKNENIYEIQKCPKKSNRKKLK